MIAPIIPLFGRRPTVASPMLPDHPDDATLCAVMEHGGPAADAAANVLLVRHGGIDGARAVLRALRGGAA